MKHLIALSIKLWGYPALCNSLVDSYGSAEAVYADRTNPRLLAGLPKSVAGHFADWDAALRRAEATQEFDARWHVRELVRGGEGYPSRLTGLADAPPVLFFLGTGPYDAPHAVSIVGSRGQTTYGAGAIRQAVKDLAQLVPDCLVVSGLAHGADITAHRTALECGLNTVAVMASGMSLIYPGDHTTAAREITRHGGLMTEYVYDTRVDRPYFLMRNRIVASLSEVLIVSEAGIRSGSLSSARHARRYGRQVFALPGRIDSEMSEGCNRLIRSGSATCFLSAEDMVDTLGWRRGQSQPQAAAPRTARTLDESALAGLPDDAVRVARTLFEEGDMAVDSLASRLNLEAGQASAMVMLLEMRGTVSRTAAGVIHLEK